MNNSLKYTCLFGGGAIRGLAYVGAIRALEELNIEYDVIGGSSVGSIFATLLACGYKSYELENLFMKVNFELFRDIHLGFGKGLGLSKGEIFIDWLNGNTVPGYATSIMTPLIMEGVTLMSLGIIGEYIGKIYMESKGRPRYIIDTFVWKDDSDD